MEVDCENVAVGFDSNGLSVDVGVDGGGSCDGDLDGLVGDGDVDGGIAGVVGDLHGERELGCGELHDPELSVPVAGPDNRDRGCVGDIGVDRRWDLHVGVHLNRFAADRDRERVGCADHERLPLIASESYERHSILNYDAEAFVRAGSAVGEIRN